MAEKDEIIHKGSEVSLREVTRDNLDEVLRLKVAEAQRKFVAPNSTSIAQAHFYPEEAWFRAIYADETPVGFLMLSDDAKKAEYFLWRLMVDNKYQGMSFGRRAIELLVTHVKTRPNATKLLTSCVPGEGSPFNFYKSLGFEPTGEVDDGEDVMELLF
ncbi:MAG: GNAT family N-acetyltransferase [Anaerolineae bacterium]|jgi:diamine N-acetyltransferase|nr:GNAT family N-acetyltransferase [Anaerolineae bacterium]